MVSKPSRVTSSASDAELIAAARSGDTVAYGFLYQRHAAAALRLAHQIVKTPDDADEVVAETFARVLYAMRGGNGPAEAFRPYLLTAVRRVAIDLVNGQRRQIPTDDADLPDPGQPFEDPMLAGLERALIARAFWSLPERWRAVLWHTEIEEERPAEVAALLGLSANGVSVLRQRAREGLRRAYLQLHLADRVQPGCRPTAGKLGRYVRGGLSMRQAREIEDHLANCADCTEACADLAAINDTLRGVLAPVGVGAAATDYLASASRASKAHALAHAPHGHARLSGLHLAAHRAIEAVTHHPITSLATAAAVAAIAVPSVYLVQAQHGHQAAPGLMQTRRHATAGTAHHSPGARRAAGGRQPTPAPTASRAPVTTRGGPPAPAKSPSRSAKPTPTLSPAPTTAPAPTAAPTATGSPTASPTPTASPSPTAPATAKLRISVNMTALLNLGVVALLKVNVSNPGTAATGPVSTSVTLPSGITLLGLPGSSSWSCSTTSGGLGCSHGALGVGAAASLSFNVLVVNLSGCGDSVIATAVSGSLSASGSPPGTVPCANSAALLDRIGIWDGN